MDTLKIRRGTTAARMAVIPVDGELVYDRALKSLFVGDGITPGGVAASGSVGTDGFAAPTFSKSIGGRGVATAAYPAPLPAVLTSDYFAAAWVCLHSLAAAQGIFGGGSGAFSWRIGTNGQIRTSAVDTTDGLVCTIPLSVNRPAHLISTRKAGVEKWLVNGIPANSGSSTLSFGGHSLLGSAKPGSDFLNGYFAEPLFGNRGLTDAECLLLYNRLGKVLPMEYGASMTPAAPSTCVAGGRYRIVTVGTTNFTLIGSISSTVGVEFIATSAGTGTGTVLRIGVMAALDDPGRYTLDQSRATTSATISTTGSWSSGITVAAWQSFTGSSGGFTGASADVDHSEASVALVGALKKGQAIKVTLTNGGSSNANPVSIYLVGATSSGAAEKSNLGDCTGDDTHTAILVPSEDISSPRLAVRASDGTAAFASISISLVGGIKDPSGNGHNLILPASGLEAASPLLP